MVATANAAAATLLAAVVLARWRLLTHPGPYRHLWVALAALAVAHPLRGVPAAAASVNNGLGRRDAAYLVAWLLVLLAAVNVISMVRELRSTAGESCPRHPHLHVALAVPIAALLGLALASGNGEGPGVTLGPTTYVLTAPATAVAWVGAVGVLSWSLARMTGLAWRYRGVAPDPAVAAGLTLGGAATAYGQLFVVQELAVAGLVYAGHQVSYGAEQLIEFAALGPTLLAICAGACLPALRDGAAAGRKIWRYWAVLRQLRPLGRALRPIVPAATRLDPLGDATVARLRDLPLRHHLAVTSVRDGLRALHPHLCSSTRDRLAVALASSGMSGPKLAAASEALWVDEALRAASRGDEPCRDPGPPTRTGATLEAEIAWLVAVSRAYKHRRRLRARLGRGDQVVLPVPAITQELDPGHRVDHVSPAPQGDVHRVG